MNDNTTGSPGTLIIQKQFLNVTVPAPTLEVSDPADSATFKNITWTTKGKSPANVLLRYDTGALTYPNNVNSGGAALTDAGGYLWQVPDSIFYNTIKVRVKADVPNDTFVSADSAAFTIKGRVILQAPTASSTFIVGNAEAINYKKLGTIGNLKIEYIRTGCGTNRIVSAGATEATSFAWTVDATDGCGLNLVDTGGTTNSTIKLTGLTHLGDANLEATSTSAAFQIRGS